jgi:hypothetical protein
MIPLSIDNKNAVRGPPGKNAAAATPINAGFAMPSTFRRNGHCETARGL